LHTRLAYRLKSICRKYPPFFEKFSKNTPIF
jgi:hypothetical protein